MAIYLGSQAVTLYLGAVEVASPGGAFLDGLQVFPAGPTVPGAPTITFVDVGSDIEFIAPENDGGSAILSYNIYVNTLFAENQQPFAPGFLNMAVLAASPGDEVEIAAVNAIGEGPKSNVFVAE